MRVVLLPKHQKHLSIIVFIAILLLCFWNLPEPLTELKHSLSSSSTAPKTSTSNNDLFHPLHTLLDNLSLHPPTNQTNPSILIFQHLPYFTPLYRASYATHKIYSEIWGYGYECSRYNKIGDGDGKVNNGKSMNEIYALYEVFRAELERDEGERYDWIFVTDVDTIISNPSIPIHLLLPPTSVHPQPLFLGNQDHNGFNAGVLILKVHPTILKLLEWVIMQFEDSLNTLKQGEIPRNDQVLLSTALNTEELGYAEGFYEIPMERFNAYFLRVGEVQMQVHFVNRLKYRYRFTPVVEENFGILREAQRQLSRIQEDERGSMGISAHGLELIGEYELARKTGEEYWRGAKNGIEGMRFLWD
ncbi:hypothetical protein I302_108326 [Kwoniella bestiolae CBS 10118]|uniref:Nucleotide-diphospho-sugar transferase domain-containing protein n=1 Tax=Kwoniella bestiolae CBS 10118 TaxID=1296100 RepID=A0A1B9FW02_9TREE|nr:hypothetical protein I302_07304 [Kwoniella bestiolae CBS 10118]OCF22954.1 hypothetical protein I302_07304 [Kwoniella bestiolae CBS 10118]